MPKLPKSNHARAEALATADLSSRMSDDAVSPSALATVAAGLLAPKATAPSAVASSASSASAPLRPNFPALSAAAAASASGGPKDEVRSVRVPPNRYTPLKEQWDAVVAPCVEHMKLLIRMNTKQRAVELKASAFTTDPGALQRGEDFVKAFMLGFDVADAVALLRLDDMYVESFEVTDVKPLKGDHLSRAIGRIAGQGGKTKFAVENATRTRIVVADQKVHILGAFANIQVSRDAICSLILGSPPGKVYNSMRNISSRMGSR